MHFSENRWQILRMPIALTLADGMPGMYMVDMLVLKIQKAERIGSLIKRPDFLNFHQSFITF